MTFSLTSSAFTEGTAIPRSNTCDGANQPIPLSWEGVPDGTAELALVMDDPDARGFVHWVVVGIAPTASALDGGTPPAGAVQGRNGFGRTGYGGPCPPSGTHRYVFTLFAVSAPLGLDENASADDVRRAAASKTLAEARLTGQYTRSR